MKTTRFVLISCEKQQLLFYVVFFWILLPKPETDILMISVFLKINYIGINLCKPGLN